jgi:hypothetical protein
VDVDKGKGVARQTLSSNLKMPALLKIPALVHNFYNFNSYVVFYVGIKSKN